MICDPSAIVTVLVPAPLARVQAPVHRTATSRTWPPAALAAAWICSSHMAVGMFSHDPPGTARHPAHRSARPAGAAPPQGAGDDREHQDVPAHRCSGRQRDDVAGELRQPLDESRGSRRGGRGPRSGRRSRRRGTRRAPRRTPWGSAASRRGRRRRAAAPRASRGRCRALSRARSARPWPGRRDHVARRRVGRRGRRSASRPGRASGARTPRARRCTPAGRARPARRSRGRARAARRRTASASCRCGSPRPAPRSRTAAPRPRGPAGRPASRAAAPPRDRRGTATSNASASAPPVRISHSSRRARSRSVTPGPDLGQERRERPVRDRAGRGDPLDLVGRLVGPQVLDPARDRDELGVGRRLGEAQPLGVGHGLRLDGDAPRARPGEEPRPGAGQVVADLVDHGVRRLAARLDRVPRVGQDHDVVRADAGTAPSCPATLSSPSASVNPVTQRMCSRRAPK